MIERMVQEYIRIFKMLFNKRALVVIGSISGIFAALSFFSQSFLEYFYKFLRFNLADTSIPITFLLITLASFALIYLQSGGNDITNKQERDLLEKLNRYRDINSSQILSNEKELKSLKEKIESLSPDKILSENDRELIIEKIISKTQQETIKNIFNSEVADLKGQIEKDSTLEKLMSSSQLIRSRIMREISDLRLRANINLILGMLITIGGLYLLWTTVSIVDASKLLKQFAIEGDESNFKFIKSLILPIVPRVLLVIFVEIFAYFFLRLYKEGLSEIKYFQNELTNVELKLVSVEYAYVTNTMESLKEGLKNLSQTERNYILNKGQTTVELEKAKSESALTQNIIKSIPAVFKKANK